jgi:hypothetical protein
MAYGLRKPFFGMDVDTAAFGAEIFDRAKALEQSFAGVFAAMLGRFAEHENKPRWGEKTPYNLFYIDQIVADFPNVQIVFICRDGRDVSAEFLDASFGPTHIYAAAGLWRDGQEAVRPAREKLGKDQWFDIEYEEFVRDPVSGLKALCAFLGEDYHDESLEFHATPTARQRGRTRDNRALAHPITDRHVGLYRDQLSIRYQRIMSWVAGDTLRALGYDDILEPLALSNDEVALMEEFDGRIRAASLDAPGGWIVFESYNDGLMDRREARRKAGIWTDHPDPPPFPIGHRFEEYFSGMRAMRKWKQHLGVKRDLSPAKSIL